MILFCVIVYDRLCGTLLVSSKPKWMFQGEPSDMVLLGFVGVAKHRFSYGCVRFCKGSVHADP